MAGRPAKPWFMATWVFKAQRKRERFAAVRARDGEVCWRCGHPMVFDGPHRYAGRAATIEHVTPLSKGGTWALDNLRLCHVGCNRHLADHEPSQKERMRLSLARRS
jgi:5-methylcytosine-specific restriction endonuclease McrA